MFQPHVMLCLCVTKNVYVFALTEQLDP